MTSKERARMIELCELMQLEEDSHKLADLANELIRLLKPKMEPRTIQQQGITGRAA